MTALTPQERREFFRLNFKTPVDFITFDQAQKTSSVKWTQSIDQQGLSQNISQTGVLFQTETAPPKVSSIVWMNLDLRTLKICQEIEKKALIYNNGLLGRVVRVEENPHKKEAYDVGVCFLTQDQKSDRGVEALLAELPKTN